MDNQNSKEKSQTEPPSQEGLVKREWEIINELQKMLKDPELTIAEKTHVATRLCLSRKHTKQTANEKGRKRPVRRPKLGRLPLRRRAKDCKAL